MEERSYFREMLLHPASVTGLFAAITAAAILSIPLGLGPAAIPIVLFLGAQGMASLFVPSSPIFREYIDRKKRAEQREEARESLIGRIRKKEEYAWPDFSFAQDKYGRMRERLVSLAQLATGGSSGMSGYDLEKLDDATVDYLRVMYARLLLRERMSSQDDRTIERQIWEIDAQIEAATREVDRKRLAQAKADLERLVESRARLPASEAAAAAQLITMAEAFEEIYHRVSADPGGAEVGEFLRSATERLVLEEEISMSVDEEMGSIKRRAQSKNREHA